MFTASYANDLNKTNHRTNKNGLHIGTYLRAQPSYIESCCFQP